MCRWGAATVLTFSSHHGTVFCHLNRYIVSPTVQIPSSVPAIWTFCWQQNVITVSIYTDLKNNGFPKPYLGESGKFTGYCFIYMAPALSYAKATPSFVSWPRLSSWTDTLLLHNSVGFEESAPQCLIHTPWRKTSHEAEWAQWIIYTITMDSQNNSSMKTINIPKCFLSLYNQVALQMYLQKNRQCGNDRKWDPFGCSKRKQWPKATSTQHSIIDLGWIGNLLL